MNGIAMFEEAPSNAIDATEKDFQQKVVDRSQEIPVLVDLWAPWCQPCKTFGPLLETLAAEFSGKFELVKVNVDESPMLAQALQVQSIPAVKLVVNKEIRDQFDGALPEPELRAFLERNLPTDSESTAAEGLKLWLAGHKPQGAAILKRIAAAEPENPVALVGLGLAMIEDGQLEETKQVLEKVTDFDLDHLPEKQILLRGLAALRAKVFLMESVNEGLSAAPQPDSTEGLFLLACQAALTGDSESALEGFLSIVQKDRKFKDDGGRRGMLAVFSLLPEDSPLLGSYRSRLSSILFA